MKTFTTLFVALLLSPICLFAQNSAPQVSNVILNHNPATQSVTFGFDVGDADLDSLEISIRVSADSGRTWLVDGISVTGDVGFPIIPGAGKTIVWNYSLSNLAAAFGPGPRAFKARIIADDRAGVNIQDIVAQVDSARLVTTLKFLEGPRHTTGGPVHMQEVRDSLGQWVGASGLQDWSHNFLYSGLTRENYVARYAGLTGEAITYGCSGHYDTVNNSPGADDNGTATAGVMEALHVLSGYEFAHSIRFFAFDAEEYGVRGSINWIQNRIPAWEDFSGLLNMEMVGYFDNAANSQTMPAGFNILFPAAYNAIAADSFRGNFLTNVANVPSTALMQAFDSCAAQYVPELRVVSMATPGTGSTTPDLRRSDHAPFWDAGLPALMLTDGADFRNPHYHSPADSVGTLDMQFFYRNVKAMVATLAKLAEPMHAGYAVSDTFLLELPVGIVEDEPASLKLWPNPSKGKLNLEWENKASTEVEISILNMEGKHLKTILNTPQGAGKQQFSFDTKALGLASGTYLLRMKQEDKISYKRFVHR